MATSELIEALQALAHERKIDEFYLIERLEQSLAKSYERILDLEWDARVTIDRQTGKIYVYELVPVGEPDEETGEYSEFEERDVTPDDVSRIAAQNAKGVISSLVREAGRQSIYDEFRGRVGDLVTGTVLQGTPDFTIVKIREGVEAELPHYDVKRNPGERNERPANEHYRHNQRLKVLIIEVRNPNADAPRARGEQARPAIVVSRTHPDLIRRLFEIEVPEIYEGVVEIKSVAREPGARSKVAVFSSIACTVCAIGLVVVDMGQPFRVWELFVYSNLGSPLMWDIIVLSTYLILSCVYLWAQIQAERGKMSAVALRVISVIALVCAVLVHSVTAWIFGLQQGREMWHTALLAPWFVSSALVCGTALVMAIAIGLRKAGYLDLDQANIVKLAKLLGAFVLVDLYFFGCDLLTEAFPAGSGLEVVQMLIFGPLAPYFWVEVIGCVLCAVVCLTPALRTNGLLVGASLLAIAAIFCKRVQLLVGGFQITNLGEMTPFANSMSITHWEGTMADAYAGMVYWPTPLEFGVTLGVVALGFLIFFLGLKFLPLRPAEEVSPSK